MQSIPGSTGSALRRSLPYRVRATAIHLGLSAVVFLAALYLIVVHWYPGFHFAVDGGWQGVRIMAAVDFVLGPLLTLVVFNPFKAPRLIAFDLTCVGIAQIAALVWGFYAIHSQHPVAITYDDGAFYSMTAEPLKIEKSPPDLLAKLSDRTPALIYVAPPTGDDEETRSAMQELVGGVAHHEDPFFFRPFGSHWATVQARRLDPDVRANAEPAFAAALPKFLEEHGGAAPDYRFFPYTGRYGECTLALDAAGTPVGAVGCDAF